MTLSKLTVKVAVLITVLLSIGTTAAAGPADAGVSAREAIVGGTTVPAGALASIALIADSRGRVEELCTGTVVAPRLVLTAGHCVENIETGAVHPASGYQVLVGLDELPPEGALAPGQLFAVSGVIPYERFRRRVDDGDAALLVLSTPTSAPPIALSASAGAAALSAGTTAMVAGWGNIGYGQAPASEQVRWANTVLQARSWCRRNAPPFYAAGEICTIDPPGYSTGACNGDSGGPLLVPEGVGGALVEVGIAIHVYDHCSTRRPTVYTRVQAIAPWVQSWIDAYANTSPGT